MIRVFKNTYSFIGGLFSEFVSKTVEIQNKTYFKYFVYLGYFYIGKIVLRLVVDLKDYYFRSFSFDEFGKKYGNGWVIVQMDRMKECMK
jgi:hypothetical protein